MFFVLYGSLKLPHEFSGARDVHHDNNYNSYWINKFPIYFRTMSHPGIRNIRNQTLQKYPLHIHREHQLLGLVNLAICWCYIYCTVEYGVLF